MACDIDDSILRPLYTFSLQITNYLSDLFYIFMTFNDRECYCHQIRVSLSTVLLGSFLPLPFSGSYAPSYANKLLIIFHTLYCTM